MVCWQRWQQQCAAQAGGEAALQGYVGVCACMALCLAGVVGGEIKDLGWGLL